MQSKYGNIILTIIAGCLVFQIFQSFRQKPVPVVIQQEAKQPPISFPQSLDVRIVGTTEPLKMDLVTIGGFPFVIDTRKPTLPIRSSDPIDVNVENTADVNIKGVDGKYMLGGDFTTHALPVVIVKP